MRKRKNILLLGATGSVGQTALEVIRRHRLKLQLLGVAAKSQVEGLLRLARDIPVKHFALFDETARLALKKKLPSSCRIYNSGEAGLLELLELKPDLVVAAASGTQTASVVLKALERGIDVALANKELLALAGPLFVGAAKKSGAKILPVDSEHNALFQFLESRKEEEVAQLVLTASGGPFLDKSLEELKGITPQQALRHPNWQMGKQVTVDSSTMANKALELIEAHWLFNQLPTEVVIHPQSIIHALVEYRDGSVKAALSPPSMLFPTQQALLYPECVETKGLRLNWQDTYTLELRPLDTKRFGFISLARQSLRGAPSLASALSAANEQATRAFLGGKLDYSHILPTVEQTLEKVPHVHYNSLEEAVSIYQHAQATARELIASA